MARAPRIQRPMRPSRTRWVTSLERRCSVELLHAPPHPVPGPSCPTPRATNAQAVDPPSQGHHSSTPNTSCIPLPPLPPHTRMHPYTPYLPTQVVDRPSQGHRFLSRAYVQPQWVFDSANFRCAVCTHRVNLQACIWRRCRGCSMHSPALPQPAARSQPSLHATVAPQAACMDHTSL